MTVDKETAKADFERFKVAMRLRLDREGMDENERKDVNEDVDILLEEVVGGRLTVDDDGLLTYHPEEGNPLTFRKPKGRSVAVIDKKKEHHKVGQSFAVIGAFTDTAPSVIQAMDWADIDILATVVGLFFVK